MKPQELRELLDKAWEAGFSQCRLDAYADADGVKRAEDINRLLLAWLESQEDV